MSRLCWMRERLLILLLEDVNADGIGLFQIYLGLCGV